MSATRENGAGQTPAARFGLSGKGEDVIETIVSGGSTMVPLMACSVLSLAVVLDRLWNLRRGKVISPEESGSAAPFPAECPFWKEES
jgi:hypothetical protein